MTITQERLQVVDFSNPYFMTGQAILVKGNSNIRTGKDLNNKKIGIVLGTTAATAATTAAGAAIVGGAVTTAANGAVIGTVEAVKNEVLD